MVLWKKQPFKSYSEVYPHFRGGGFTLAEVTAAENPPAVPAYEPTEGEQKVLENAYNDWSHEAPAWDLVRADLLASGMDLNAIKELTVRQAVHLILSRNTEGAFRVNTGQTDKKTDKGRKKEKKLPPHDVNNTARYIKEQRKLISEGKRPKAAKKALIAECVSDPRACRRMEKALQPSRYGWLLDI